MRRRRLSALQLEVTSRCTRRCATCARSAMADRWLDGDLSEESWRRLAPDLGLVRHLHLQGWGEPLLHPGLETMAAEAHEAGCRVGVTSNGELLGDAAGWLVSGTVDVLALSVAGADADSVRLRDGLAATEVIGAGAELAARRTSRRRPRLHLSVLLTRDNASEIESVTRAAAAAGFDAVLVNHLDFVPDAALYALAASTEEGVGETARAGLEKAAAAARAAGIELRLPALEAQEMLVCDLDPRRIVSVRWDGRVGPCVMLNLPVRGPVPRFAGGCVRQIEAPVFGWLGEASLAEILDGGAYRAFTGPFERREAADAHYREWGLTASGWGVVGLADLDRAYAELERTLSENPFPGPCAGCPKGRGW